MPRQRRTSGPRFSAVDGGFILASAATAWLLRDRLEIFVWLIPVAVGHFFLFCNVFRVRRSYELIWTGLFLTNMIAWMFSSAFTWLGVLAIQLPVTAAIIILEMRSPRYHGVFSRQINREHLDDWLNGEMY